jgi:hypothetical protein
LIVTQGTIETATPFSLGTRYEFGDPSGSIILLVWNDAIDPQKQQELLAVGVTLSVTGQIDEFNNELEIVPRSPGDVVVLATPAVTPEPTATKRPKQLQRQRRQLKQPPRSSWRNPAAANTPNRQKRRSSGVIADRRGDRRASDGCAAKWSTLRVSRRASSSCSTTAPAACS